MFDVQRLTAKDKTGNTTYQCKCGVDMFNFNKQKCCHQKKPPKS